MRCAVKNCLSNEDGYCMDSSYVSIDENGECDQMTIIEAEEKEDKELLVEKIRKLQTYKLAPELEKLVSLEKVIAILEGEENVF